MGAFEFTALDTSGREKRGVLEGDTPRHVRQQLREQGLAPVTVNEVRQREERTASLSRFAQRGISAADMSLITRQFSTLVRAGLPIEEALQTVSRQTEKARLRNLLMAVRSRVVEGHSLAAGLRDFPHVFSELYCSTVAAGEHSGHLDVVLERLADYTETRQILQQKVFGALLYPVIFTAVSVLIVMFLLTYVVPQIVQVFDNINQELPLLTRILIQVSDIARQYWLVLALVTLVGIIALHSALRRPLTRKYLHGLMLRLPVAGRMIRGMNTALFARTFSILIASGVPVIEAMRISAQVIVNLPMRAAVEEAALRVREGASLFRSLDRSGLFPPLAINLIASGEASGKLDSMLERAATAQEREMEMVLTTLLTVFQTVLILVMGLVVVLIVLAILLPIFDLNQLVK